MSYMIPNVYYYFEASLNHGSYLIHLFSQNIIYLKRTYRTFCPFIYIIKVYTYINQYIIIILCIYHYLIKNLFTDLISVLF